MSALLPDLTRCPQCSSRDCVQVDAQKAECLDCGEVFNHSAPELEEEAA